MPKSSSQLTLDLNVATTSAEFLAPAGYSGLYGFHKYWGKKPPETVSFLVEQLATERALVFDPFLGSGAIARECILRNRRFVGCDLNPLAVELASFCVSPTRFTELRDAIAKLEQAVRGEIESQYVLEDGAIASHYLWQEDVLRSVWTKENGKRTRRELPPTPHDQELFEQYQQYEPHGLRPLRIFQNPRINARAGMGWSNLFTGRAIRSIELIRDAIITHFSANIQKALLLVLTASVGQMSKMVFAIERRGKASGTTAPSRVEVGSWVIGLWTPGLRFEVNAWNCFSNKATKLLNGLRDEHLSNRVLRVTGSLRDALQKPGEVALIYGDAEDVANELPEKSVDLVLTDPPHGDRIPYLEMSEIWNSILGHEPAFEKELVVSNARERKKDLAEYSSKLVSVFAALSPKLTPQGIVALLFNSKSSEEWQAILSSIENSGLTYRGRVPMVYSAGSVVQDNREGAMGHDFVVLFTKTPTKQANARIEALAKALPNWSETRPE